MAITSCMSKIEDYDKIFKKKEDKKDGKKKQVLQRPDNGNKGS